MTRRAKTVAVPRGDSRRYLAKAEQFAAEARLALDGSRNDAAMLNAIHAAISAVDAVTTALAGMRSADPDHQRAVDLLEEVASGSEEIKARVRQMRQLLARKNIRSMTPGSCCAMGRSSLKRPDLALIGSNASAAYSHRCGTSCDGSGPRCLFAGYTFPDVDNFTFPHLGTNFEADEVRVFPEDGRGAAIELSSLDFLAVGLSEVTLRGFHFEPDCNGNGVDDFVDISEGGARDLDRDGVPDECRSVPDLTIDLNTGFDQASGELLPLDAAPDGTDDDDWRWISADPTERRRWCAILPRAGRTHSWIAAGSRLPRTVSLCPAPLISPSGAASVCRRKLRGSS